MKLVLLDSLPIAIPILRLDPRRGGELGFEPRQSDADRHPEARHLPVDIHHDRHGDSGILRRIRVCERVRQPVIRGFIAAIGVIQFCFVEGRVAIDWVAKLTPGTMTK